MWLFFSCLSSPLALPGASQSQSIFSLYSRLLISLKLFTAVFCYTVACLPCWPPVKWCGWLSLLPAPPLTWGPTSCTCNRLLLAKVLKCIYRQPYRFRMWKEQVFLFDITAQQDSYSAQTNKQKTLADHFYEKWIQIAGSSILATQWAMAYNLGVCFYTCIKKWSPIRNSSQLL